MGKYKNEIGIACGVIMMVIGISWTLAILTLEDKTEYHKCPDVLEEKEDWVLLKEECERCEKKGRDEWVRISIQKGDSLGECLELLDKAMADD